HLPKPSEHDSAEDFLKHGSHSIGRLVSLNLATVVTDVDSYDRQTVDWIYFGVQTSAQDVLLLRDGQQKTGQLTGCSASDCEFDSVPVPRKQIEWIGIAGAAMPPPSASDPTKDEIFLADQSDIPCLFLGISMNNIVS